MSKILTRCNLSIHLRVKELSKNVDTEQKQNAQTKPVGVDKNVQTLIYNPVTNLNNPTTTSSNPVKKQDNLQKIKPVVSEFSEEEVFFKTIINLFEYNPCFNPNPYPVLVKNFDYATVFL